MLDARNNYNEGGIGIMRGTGLFSEYPLGYCVQEFNFLSREIVVMKMMELCKITFTSVR